MQKVAQNVAISLGYFFSQKSQLGSKSSPIGKKLTNLVTLLIFGFSIIIEDATEKPY